MANDDHDLDDFDIDDGMDIPDFDPSGLDGSGGTKREPIERAAGGFLQGVTETSMQRGFQRKLIENALPKGYGKAFDDVSEAVSVGQDLYDSTTSALRPYERTIKKIGRRVSEKAERFLPEGLANKLKEMTEPDNDQADKIDPLESKITSELGEIFGAQMQQNAEERASDENRENVKEVVEEQRHRTQLDVLKTIRSGQDRLVAYQDKVTAGYQRKSLEYQIRQLNVSRRQYELLEGHVKENKVQMDSVVKNTALPEFVKLRGSEAAKQIMRQRLLGNMTEGLQDRLGGVGRRFTENLTQKVEGFNRSLVEGIQGIGDAMDATEGVEIDPVEMAASGAGGAALNAAASPLGRKLGGYLRKIPGVERVGDTLEYGSDNKEEVFRRLLKEQLKDQPDFDSGEPDTRSVFQKTKDAFSSGTSGIRASGAQILLDLMGPEYTPERTLGGQSVIDSAQEVVPYTSMTDRAITEIIPDILTNILHETEMIRTGDDTIDRRVYDADRRTMRRQGDVQKDLMARVMPEGTRDNIREDLDELIAAIDDEGRLSNSARESLKRQMLEDMASNKGFMPERYVESGGLSSVESEDDAKDIELLMRSRFLNDEGKVRNTDDVQRDRRALSTQYNYAQKEIPDYQDVVAEINAVYGPEMLRRMGIISAEEGIGRETSDRIDNKAIFDNLMSGTEFSSRAMAAVPGERIQPTFQERLQPEPEPEPEPELSSMEITSRLVQQTPPIDGDVDQDSMMTRLMGRVADSVDRLVNRFMGQNRLDEYLDLLVDRTTESQEYLNLLVDNVSSMVDVRKAANNEEQFEHVLEAIQEIDPNENLDINNDWLKKIYDLMLKCCGPDGDGPGPGGPRGGGPTGGPSFTPLKNVPYLLPPIAQQAFDTGLSGGKELLSKTTKTVTGTVDRARKVDYKAAATGLADRAKSFSLKDTMGQAQGYLQPYTEQASTKLKPITEKATEAFAPIGERIGQGITAVKDNERVKTATEKLGGAGESLREGWASLGLEDRIRSMTDMDLGSLDPTVLYDKVQDILDYDYAGRKDATVEALRNLSKDDLVNLVTQFDREQAMSTVKEKAGLAKDKTLAGAEKAFGAMKDQYEAVRQSDTSKVQEATGKLTSFAEQLFGSIREKGSQLKVPDNVVDFNRFKLQAPEALQGIDVAGMKRAVGDTVGQYTDTVRSRTSSAASQMGNQFGEMKESTTDALEQLTAMFGKDAMGKIGSTDDEAANDPRIVLSMLKKQAKDVLTAMEESKLTSEASTFVERLRDGSSTILSGLQGKIRKQMSGDQPSDETSSGEIYRNRDGFWSEAWEMLSEIKDHMDRKTNVLVEAIQNISLASGEGAGGPGAIKRLGGKLADGAGGIASYYGKAFSGIGSMIKGGGKGAGSILSGVGGRVGKMIGGKESIVDIYLEGQEDPIMLARDLKKGRYMNREGGGEVKRLNDIEGDVIDVETGNIIATADDVQNKRLYVLGGKDTEGASLKDIASKAIDYTTKPSRMLFQLGGKAVSSVKDYLNRPQDIYVKGEEKPRLLAIILKRGGYFSAATGEPVYTIDDIDGPVKNEDGNVVLTEEDIRQGLVNARGKAIRTGMSAGASAISSTVEGIGNFYRGAFEMGKGALQKTMGFFGGGDGEGGGGGLFGGSKKQVEWLEKIYNLLDARIAMPEEEVRQGSWQQMMGKDADGSAANDPEDVAEAARQAKGKSLFGMLGAGGLLDKLNPFSGDGFGSSAAGAAAGSAAEGMFDRESREEKRERKRNRKNKPGKKGLLGKLWGGVKKVGKWAVPAATALLPSAGTLAAGASAVGTGLATAAGAIGSVLSAPVVLAGAAVAGVGIGAYMLYKHFSDRPDGPIHRFRLAQYGIDPDNKDHVAKLNALEDKLSGEIQYRKGQSPTLSESLDMDELVQITGVDPEDEGAVQNWALWFQRRFKPVFFSHMVAAREIESGVEPSDIEDAVEKEQKAVFIKGVHFKGNSASLYSQMSSPFPDLEEVQGPGHVQSVYDKVLKEVSWENKMGPAKTGGRSFPMPDDYEVPDETTVKVVPKKPTLVDSVTEGVDRRVAQSPTNKINLAEKEATAIVAKGAVVPSEKELLEKYESGAFDPMDYYRKQVARKEAYERHGLPSDHIKIPTINRMGDEGESVKAPSVPIPLRKPKTTPSETETRSTRAWGTALDMTPTPETEDEERVIEERKRKESRVVKETETQVASNTSQMNKTMNRMVSILSDSHGVQKEIRDTLGKMNHMFKERYEKDGQEKDNDRSGESRSEAYQYNRPMGQNAQPPVKKVRPLSTSR
jgi:hypothetical protein